MLRLESSGSYSNIERWLNRMKTQEIFATLNRFGAEGVSALSAATPVDTGLTAASWSYEIRKTRTSYTIVWKNSHMAGGAPVAILLQYGHGTGTGGYVQGRDYINPAMRPIFDRMAAEAWKAVTSRA